MSMTLEDIYEYLSTGELAQVVMGTQDINDPDSGVPRARYKQLRNSVQLALTDLHKRFLINERTLIVDIASGPGDYKLTYDYAQSNVKSVAPVQYIIDANDPFQSTLLKISRVEDQNGNELPLNILSNPRSLITPNDETINVPKEIDESITHLHIIYHADHAEIDKFLADSSPQIVKINLPRKYLHAMTLFVASRVMNPIGLRQEFHEGNNYFAKYLQAVMDLKNQGMDQTRTDENVRLHDNGWA